MRNKLISFCLIIWSLTVLPLTAMAQQYDNTQQGSISVTLAAPKPGQPMAGAELSIYHVADATWNAEGNLNYAYTDDFARCGYDLADPALAQKLDAFVKEHSISARKIVTDARGKAVCGDLPLGLYFVRQTGDVDGFATCTSFLVTVPMKTNAGYEYNVNATPKTDVIKVTDITIKKIWNTGNSTKIPASVTVQLLDHGKVVETATLSKHNNWQITYEDMPESDGYSIKEHLVPGYTATYARKGYVFIVTNTPGLAQTGQIVWPIPVFAMAGIALLAIGFAILRKPGKKDA